MLKRTSVRAREAGNTMSEQKLFRFYETLRQRAAEAGIPVSVTGGHACIHYQIALFTKDCDLVVASEGVRTFLGVLEGLKYETRSVSYRIGLSAPLEAPWCDHGWTSHFEYGGPAKNRPRIDVFVRPPRLARRFSLSKDYLSHDALAETKKTQREKDWEFVTALGVQLLRAGDSRGYRHVFDAEEFLYFKDKVRIPDDLKDLRPNLTLDSRDLDRIETAFDIEKKFWMKLDAKRVKIYRDAGRTYVLRAQEKREALHTSVFEQHNVLVDLANKFLPVNPIADYGVRKLGQDVKDQLLRMYPQEFESFLPNLEALIHEDGLYHP